MGAVLTGTPGACDLGQYRPLKNRFRAGSPTQHKGRFWEKRAESFLRRNGLSTRERNFNCRSGEIDLVMDDGESIVFVEVRFRNNKGYGSGADTVTRQKQARLIRAAQYYLCKNPRLSEMPCRFDVISVDKNQGATAFHWIRNAFETVSG